MYKSLCALTTAALISGCTSHTVSHYTLGQLAEETNSITTPAQKAVLLQTIEFPEYLESRNIAVRTENNELTLLETRNWAEPFDTLVTRYITERLRTSQESMQVTSSTRYVKPEKKIRISFFGFEKNDSTQTVEIAARWWILDGKTNLPVRQGVFKEQTAAGDSFNSSAAAHALLLKKFVSVISTELADK